MAKHDMVVTIEATTPEEAERLIGNLLVGKVHGHEVNATWRWHASSRPEGWDPYEHAVAKPRRKGFRTRF